MNSKNLWRESNKGLESLRLGREISKADLLAFYTQSNFGACRFCDILNQRETCTPAIQIGDE